MDAAAAAAAKVPVNDQVAADPIASGPLLAWGKRVRWVGGLIQAAFAAFWLVRGSAAVGGAAAHVLLAAFGLAVIGVFSYAIRAAAGAAPRPRDQASRQIERQVTIATVIEFAAAIGLPVLASAAGHPDWVLPSIAITIGPLLLWLGHRLCVPRYRLVGWVLTIGPVILIATMSGTALVASAGIAAGLLLLGTALFGFHDLAAARPTAQRSAPANALAAAGSRS